jgi:hypothetical protein
MPAQPGTRGLLPRHRAQVECLHRRHRRRDQGREGGPDDRGAKEEFGHGVGYQYAHNFEGGWVDQEYIPADVEYYHPTDRGEEAKIKERVEELRKRKGKSSGDGPPSSQGIDSKLEGD